MAIIIYNYILYTLKYLRSRSCQGIHVQASMILTRADYCVYTQLYKITYKYYVKTYFNGSYGVRTRVLLIVCLTPCQLSHTGNSYIACIHHVSCIYYDQMTITSCYIQLRIRYAITCVGQRL